MAAADGTCIYGIPCDAERVLRIDTATQRVSTIGDSLGTQGGKWIGGVLGPDGCVYGVPFNSARVLRFDPRSGAAGACTSGADMPVLPRPCLPQFEIRGKSGACF